MINKHELDKFSKNAQHWWNKKSVVEPLQYLNPVRINYIKEQITRTLNVKTLDQISIIDIGCGAGLLSEPLARLNTKITAIDPSQELIAIAKKRAQKQKLNINYQVNTLGQILQKKEKFDVVICLEVIEHVDKVHEFIADLTKLLNNKGIIIISSINKNMLSLLKAKILAEYILKLVPIGTHEWKKFIPYQDVINIFEENNVYTCDISGIKYNPSIKKWSINKTDLAVNYFISAQKLL